MKIIISLMLLIVVSLLIPTSCIGEDEIDEPKQIHRTSFTSYALYLTITNKTTNHLYIKSIAKQPYYDYTNNIQSNTSITFLGLTKELGLYGGWEKYSTNDILLYYSNIYIYNTNRTNLIFKITNIGPLLSEVNPRPFDPLDRSKFQAHSGEFTISITESLFTNIYYGTTNE